MKNERETMSDSAFNKPHTFCKCEACGATVRDSRHSETDCETIRLLRAKITENTAPPHLTLEKFQELAQHEWFMCSETMPKIAPEVFEAIYQRLIPHLASAQAAKDHEAMKALSTIVYEQGDFTRLNYSPTEEGYKVVEDEIPEYTDKHGVYHERVEPKVIGRGRTLATALLKAKEYNAILAAKEQLSC